MINPNPYITVNQAVDLTGLARRTIFSHLALGLYAVKPSNETSANGKSQTLIRLASLPPQAQLKYWGRALPDGSRPRQGINLAEAHESAQTEGMRRLPIVQNALAIIKARQSVSRRMADLAAQSGETARTIYRWIKAYQLEGLPGLLPRWGKKRGRFTALPSALQEFVKGEYLHPSRPSPTTVYRRLVVACQHWRVPMPSQKTVDRFIRTLPLPAVVLAREGSRAWRAQAEPKIHRDFGDLAVGEIWVGDHREFDIFVRLGDEPGATIARPWLTAWLDLRSRACTGWHVDLIPNSDTIALALRAGILRFGVPRELYKDNGKDYRCHYLNGHSTVSKAVRFSPAMQAALQPGVLSRLGITARDCLPYTPWAKPIESWFSHTFPQWERTLPGWCGRDARQRPEKLSGEIQRGELLTLEEFTGRVAERIEQVNRMEHSALDATPLLLWQDAIKEIPETRALDLLLLRHKPCKVYTQGIKLFGRWYWSDDLVLHVGQVVDVRYDPNEIGRLIVFGVTGEGKGRFLCEAINRPAYSMHASREDLKRLAKRKRTARKAAEEYAGQRRVLFNEDEVLRELAEASRRKKVVNLRSRDRQPASEPLVIPRITGLERPLRQVRKEQFGRTLPPTHDQTTDGTDQLDRDALMRLLLED